jgi:hypothetical protein
MMELWRDAHIMSLTQYPRVLKLAEQGSPQQKHG